MTMIKMIGYQIKFQMSYLIYAVADAAVAADDAAILVSFALAVAVSRAFMCYVRAYPPIN